MKVSDYVKKSKVINKSNYNNLHTKKNNERSKLSVESEKMRFLEALKTAESYYDKCIFASMANKRKGLLDVFNNCKELSNNKNIIAEIMRIIEAGYTVEYSILEIYLLYQSLDRICELSRRENELFEIFDFELVCEYLLLVLRVTTENSRERYDK